MLITCNNKGCLKASNAVLNPQTLEVICLECDKPITNISEAMKRALKSFGQVIREERKAFLMACNNCKANREVVLNQDDETVCKICFELIHTAEAFKLAIEESGGFKRITVPEEKLSKNKKKTTKKKTTRKKKTQ